MRVEVSLCLCSGALYTRCIDVDLGCTRRDFGSVSDFVGLHPRFSNFLQELHMIIPGLHEDSFSLESCAPWTSLALPQYSLSGTMRKDHHQNSMASAASAVCRARVSSFFMWFSRCFMTSKLCTLGPCRPCAFSVSQEQPGTSRMYVVHFVSVRSLQAPSFRLAEHASCFALRLLSHLLYRPSGDLTGSWCGSPGLAKTGLPATFGCGERKRKHVDSFTLTHDTRR